MLQAFAVLVLAAGLIKLIVAYVPGDFKYFKKLYFRYAPANSRTAPQRS